MNRDDCPPPPDQADLNQIASTIRPNPHLQALLKLADNDRVLDRMQDVFVDDPVAVCRAHHDDFPFFAHKFPCPQRKGQARAIALRRPAARFQ
ncbi:hypothetical protein [Nocardioides sp. Kera G14]|uniref:hypothetical protein n=1 Tax=Nocardioides sp. Kera G14 TaxID=2884264 RepID=UPI001D0FA9E7|nr:hypothetical protein [Nocardioides sp. Kera G14]UDY24219.1 hypothetical protein LH076_02670 [Nocardioides sp. Kera G14]